MHSSGDVVVGDFDEFLHVVHVSAQGLSLVSHSFYDFLSRPDLIVDVFDVVFQTNVEQTVF